jgi:hypothetical protein
MRGDESSDDPRVIRENIERTRAQMSETIDRIQYRLDPGRLRSEAEEAVREATIGKVEDMAYQAKRKAKRAQRGIINKVKENPVPAALIGLGLGWLMMSGSEDEYDYDTYADYDYEVYERPSRYVGPRADYSRRYTSSEYPRYSSTGESWRENDWDYQSNDERSRMDEARQRAGEAVESVRDRAQGMTHSAQEQAEHLGDRVQERASRMRERMGDQADYLRHQAQWQTQRTKRSFNQAMDNNPLMVGALALAAGALLGLSVPSTHAEDEWMGEQRDRFVGEAKEQVQSKTQETVNKVKSVATEAKEAAKDAAKDVEAGKPIGDAAKEAANRTQQKAKQENLTGSAKG